MAETPPPSLVARAKPVFLAVRELPPPARDEALDRLCAGDDALRRVVEQLLAGEQAPLRFETLAEEIVTARDAMNDQGESSDAGARIGPYRVLSKLGEGGFGVVYMAEQDEPVRRRVALKILKLGMDTRQIVSRFEAERQALAIMDHPAIARVFDAGATRTGRPYFVMELVGGEPITAYCDRHALTIAQRLALFRLVCDGVQHAHQKGIIHRDLKPGNILVGEVDGKPAPKIIDFGIAKAIAEPLTQKTFFTQHGQFIGTPEYISPEQAAGSQDIDTRTDVYSLGVLLYELLVGSTPFTSQELRSAAFGEIQRIIREVDPPKPSTRLSKVTETRATVATRRGIPPERLDRSIRGDLDWIVMRALEKDRARRYDSAGSLSRDILRHLSGEPVVAAPPSRTYRVGKFVRRHKVGVTAGAIVGFSLVAGVVGTSTGLAWALRERATARLAAASEAQQRAIAENSEKTARQEAARAEKEKVEAQAARERAELVASFMSEVFSGVGPAFARGRDSTMLRELMEQAVSRIEAGEMKAAPSAELLVRENLGQVCIEIGAYERARRMLEPAVEVARSVYGGDHEMVATSLYNLATLEQAIGGLEHASDLFRESMEMRERLYPGNHRLTAASTSAFAYVEWLRGNTNDGEMTLFKALDMHRKAKPQDEAGLVSTFNRLSEVVRARGDFTQARITAQSALGACKSHFPGDHPLTVASLVSLAAAFEGLNDHPGAERLLLQAREMDRRLHETPQGITPVLAAAPTIPPPFIRDVASAERILRRNLENARKARPGDNSTTANYLLNLALVVKERHDCTEAAALLNESLEMQRRLHPEGHPETITVLRCLAVMQVELGNLDDAARTYREMLAIQMRLRPGAQPDTSATLFSLGMIAEQRGDPATAEDCYLRCLQMSKQLWVIHPQLGHASHRLARLTRQRGDLAAAETLAAEAVSYRKRLGTPGTPDLAASLRQHAEILSSLDRVEEAEPVWRETLDCVLRSTDVPDPREIAAAQTGLGSCLLAQSKYPEAESSLLSAHGMLLPTGSGDDAGRIACLDGLCRLYAAWNKAEPGRAHDAQEAEWRRKREAER